MTDKIKTVALQEIAIYCAGAIEAQHGEQCVVTREVKGQGKLGPFYEFSIELPGVWQLREMVARQQLKVDGPTLCALIRGLKRMQDRAYTAVELAKLGE